MCESIKKYIVIIVMGMLLFIIWIITSYIAISTSKEKDYLTYYNNSKALESELDSIKETNRVYKSTINELQESKDSVELKLKAIIKDLNIKNKNIERLSYIKSIASKKDTIKLIDTIFVNNLDIDTIIKDEWYSINLKLKYPDSIIVEPTFKSEKVVVTSIKEEYIKKPSNWFCALFTKKHKFLEVTVKDNNPYIEEEYNKHIEIVK